MCTVTYIPQPGNAFILTSNRDEQISRNVSSTSIASISQHKTILFPKDPLSGGTWIAVSSQNRVACLLNGALVKHAHQPPYRKSRGLVMLDLFKYQHVHAFIEKYDLDQIEPFTLVIADSAKLFEFHWDGNKRHVKELDTEQPHIWSSVTLYDPDMIEDRQRWFNKWLKESTNKGPEEVIEFHHFGGQGNSHYGYVMNRDNKVQTLSITSIIKDDRSASMEHHDLINQTLSREHIEFYEANMESN